VRFPQAGDTIPLGADRMRFRVVETQFVDDDPVLVKTPKTLGREQSRPERSPIGNDERPRLCRPGGALVGIGLRWCGLDQTARCYALVRSTERLSEPKLSS
jgi:hypothetical protein